MGGEKSPEKNLEGANLFLKRNKEIKDCFFYFFGNEHQVKKRREEYLRDKQAK